MNELILSHIELTIAFIPIFIVIISYIYNYLYFFIIRYIYNVHSKSTYIPISIQDRIVDGAHLFIPTILIYLMLVSIEIAWFSYAQSELQYYYKTFSSITNKGITNITLGILALSVLISIIFLYAYSKIMGISRLPYVSILMHNESILTGCKILRVFSKGILVLHSDSIEYITWDHVVGVRFQKI